MAGQGYENNGWVPQCSRKPLAFVGALAFSVVAFVFAAGEAQAQEQYAYAVVEQYTAVEQYTTVIGEVYAKVDADGGYAEVVTDGGYAEVNTGGGFAEPLYEALPAEPLYEALPAETPPVEALLAETSSVEAPPAMTYPLDPAPLPGPASEPEPTPRPEPAPIPPGQYNPEVPVDPEPQLSGDAGEQTLSPAPTPAPVTAPALEPTPPVGPETAPPVGPAPAPTPVASDNKSLVPASLRDNKSASYAPMKRPSSAVPQKAPVPRRSVAASAEKGSWPLSSLKTMLLRAGENLRSATASVPLILADGSPGSPSTRAESSSSSKGAPQPLSPSAPPIEKGDFSLAGGSQMVPSGGALLLLCVLMVSGLVLLRRDGKLFLAFREIQRPSLALLLPLERPG